MKVTGTPSLFLNGAQLGTDALTYAGLSKLVDAKLAGMLEARLRIKELRLSGFKSFVERHARRSKKA